MVIYGLKKWRKEGGKREVCVFSRSTFLPDYRRQDNNWVDDFSGIF